jgi:hypothetical protein
MVYFVSAPSSSSALVSEREGFFSSGLVNIPARRREGDLVSSERAGEEGRLWRRVESRRREKGERKGFEEGKTYGGVRAGIRLAR